MDYLNLIDVYKKEKNSSQLLPISRDFYQKTEQMISQCNDNVERKNMMDTFNFLKEKRMQKILIYLAYDRQISNEACMEELELYSKIKSLIKKNKIQQSSKIKINVDVPEIITTTGSKLGPYSKDEIIEVSSNEDVMFIIENKIGEKVNQ